MNQEKIGKYIYELRIKNNLTQKDLADKLSITSQAVSKWENGRGIPDIEQLNKLSEIFNVDIKEIINGEDNKKEPKKNKKSIYISKIECSEEEKKEYLDVECILYEKNNSIEKIIYEEGKILSYDNYDKSNAKSINELLSNIEFNIDSYDCSCNNATCNNLYLRVNALNIDNKIVTYNIPLELENKCNN